MDYFTTQYDKLLMSKGHYANHYHMLPFIGAEYPERDKKLLLIAESHYIPEGSTFNLEEWYDLDSDSIEEQDEDVYQWSETRAIANHRSHPIYKNMESAILDSGFNLKKQDNPFQYAAFMNYFQRPGQKQGESIEVNATDARIALENLALVIEAIQPTHIMVVSQKAWDHIPWTFIESYAGKIVFDVFPYPNSAWWNRIADSYGGVSGREKFINFLKEHALFG